MNLIRKMGVEKEWKLDLGKIASIWKGGCIIRAQFLDRITAAYTNDPQLVSLLMDRNFAEEIKSIIEFAKAAVVLWTEQSVKSTFVIAEASVANQLDILIPVRLDQCEPPLPFNVLHTLDLSDWKGDSLDPLLDPLIQAIEEKKLSRTV